jgi:hypothetical protein
MAVFSLPWGAAMRTIVQAIVLVLVGLSSPAHSQTAEMNFKDRQAIIINNVPQQIELRDFKFENKFVNTRFELHTDLRWKNTSNKPITAFEIVILKYDPFNRFIPGGGRWMITGTDSANWAPLMPSQVSGDGIRGYSEEAVMTSLVYVRAIRYEDGGVWTADIPGVEAAIRQRLPVLKDLGNVNPPITEQKKE